MNFIDDVMENQRAYNEEWLDKQSQESAEDVDEPEEDEFNPDEE